MKSNLLVFLFTLFFVPTLYSQNVSEAEAKLLAGNFLAGNGMKQASKLVCMQNHLDDVPAYYIFNRNNPPGFVIISADKSVTPILAFSDESNFLPLDAAESNGMLEILQNYSHQIEQAAETGLTTPNHVTAEWKMLSKGDAASASKSLSPLVKTKWDQDCFFNAMCPVDPLGACGHANVGSVATAMAQIIRYHQYPASGHSSNSYVTFNYGSLQANFAATTYQYSHMPLYLTNHNMEAARLAYHCGVAVEMRYGLNTSYANSSDVPTALMYYFKYDNTAQYVHSASYSLENWKTLIRSELDSRRPLYFSGQGSGSHTFICDGYWGNDFFHFNWGWGGIYNGYYNIGLLNPGIMSFTLLQSAIIGIQPPDPPVANMSADISMPAPGEYVNFTDLSEGNPLAWKWTFEGGTPSTSTLQNPTAILYDSVGDFSVKLQVQNANGMDSLVSTAHVKVRTDAAPYAEFLAQDTLLCSGDTLQLQDLSRNFPDAWEWTIQPSSYQFINGTSDTSASPYILLQSPGYYTVGLKVENAYASDEQVKQDYIKAGGHSVPWRENFELGDLSDVWELVNPDGYIGWTGFYRIFGNGSSRKAAWLNFSAYKFPQAIGERDRFISPALDLSSHNDAVLRFSHSYVLKTIDDTGTHFNMDSLIIKISDDCGDTWTRIFADGGGNDKFATQFVEFDNFIPQEADDWCGSGWGSDCNTIDISSWAGKAGIRVMFEGYNGGGNNLFIDDIYIGPPDSTSGINDLHIVKGFHVFPNPVKDVLSLKFLQETSSCMVSVRDISGREVLPSRSILHPYKREQIIDVRHLKPGIYFVEVVDGSSRSLEKIIKY